MQLGELWLEVWGVTLVDVSSKNSYSLDPWHKEVSTNKKPDGIISIFLKENELSFLDQPQSGNISGWYASYFEGVFVFFKDNRGRLLIGWRDKVIDVRCIKKIVFFSNWKKQSFECFDGGGHSLLMFNYMTFRELLFHPLKLFDVIFESPDEWDLVLYNDLPRHISGRFQDGTIFNVYDDLMETKAMRPVKV